MTDESTLGGRALAVRKEAGKTQIQMAQFLGLSTATWQKIERGEGIPSGETLLAFEKLGVNPGWVLSGHGPKKLDAPSTAPSPSTGVNIGLLQQLHDIVQAVYVECKRTPPPRALTADAGELYNELLGMVGDIRDKAVVTAVIPVLRDRFKERISKAEPGSTKAVGS